MKTTETNMGLDPINVPDQQLIKKDGTTNIHRHGLNHFAAYNFYQKMIMVSWTKFFFIIFGFYLGINTVFGTIYYFMGVTESGVSIPDMSYHYWLKTFFLSTQTITTTGYGQIAQIGLWVNLVSSIEALAGLLFFSLITGLLYGRFSKPTAKLFYSNNILISPFKDVKILSIRLANAKIGQLIEAQAQLIISVTNTYNKERQRRFHNVKLLNNQISFFTGSWTISHIIDKDSPIYNLNANELDEKDVEFILMVNAIDDAYGQTVYSRMSYQAHEVVWNANFQPISYLNDDKETVINIKDVGKYEWIKD